MKLKLVTLDEAIVLLNEAHQIDPAKGKNIYSKKTLYNMIYKKELKRYGPKHRVQLDADEVLLKLGS